MTDDQQRARGQFEKFAAGRTLAINRYGEYASPYVQNDWEVWQAATAALRAAPEWQPIETAPKDSRWLMIGIAGRNEIMLGYWSRLHQGWWGQTSAHGEFEIWQRATHWRPMPDAPAARPQGVK